MRLSYEQIERWRDYLANKVQDNFGYIGMMDFDPEGVKQVKDTIQVLNAILGEDENGQVVYDAKSLLMRGVINPDKDGVH